MSIIDIYMKNDNNYGHVLKYAGLFGGVQGLGILMNLVRNKFVAVLLGPAGMGLTALFNSALTFFAQATNLGISFSAVRHLSETFESGDKEAINRIVATVRAWSMLTALIGMAAFAMAAPALCRFFSLNGHTIDFILLSPIVAMTAITGGETAILKAVRQLRALAVVQFGTVVAAMAISVPVYWVYGMSGIVPVLLLLSLATTWFTAHYSLALFPVRLCHGYSSALGRGRDMLRLGVAFVLAGIMGSGAEMAIRSFLNASANLDAVGLYNAAYALTITYAGMVFSSMETDYFPRLSAVNRDNEAINLLANRQIEVSILLVAPMLALLIVALPLVLPLLYSHRFMPVVGMSQAAVFSMYFKAAILPVAYITLAKGHSKAYFILESVFDVAMVVLVVLGYRWLGLVGTGVALSLAYLLDLAMIVAYANRRYNFRLTPSVLRYMAVQYSLGVVAYAFAVANVPLWISLTGSLAAVLASGGVSIYVIMYKKTSLWDSMKRKITRRNG